MSGSQETYSDLPPGFTLLPAQAGSATPAPASPAAPQQQAQAPMAQESYSDLPPGFKLLPAQATPAQSDANAIMAGVAKAAGAATPGSNIATPPPQLQPLIDRYADAHGVPRPLAYALFGQESNFGAASPNIGQVTAGTAANPGYGLPPLPAGQISNPAANVDFSLRYLSAKAQANGLTNLADPKQAAAAAALFNGGGDPAYVSHIAARMPPGSIQVADASGQTVPAPPPAGANPAQPPQGITMTGGGPTGLQSPGVQRAMRLFQVGTSMLASPDPVQQDLGRAAISQGQALMQVGQEQNVMVNGRPAQLNSTTGALTYAPSERLTAIGGDAYDPRGNMVVHGQLPPVLQNGVYVDPITRQPVGPQAPFAGNDLQAQSLSMLSTLAPKVQNGTATPGEMRQYSLALRVMQPPVLNNDPATGGQNYVTPPLPAGIPSAAGGAPGTGSPPVTPGAPGIVPVSPGATVPGPDPQRAAALGVPLVTSSPYQGTTPVQAQQQFQRETARYAEEGKDDGAALASDRQVIAAGGVVNHILSTYGSGPIAYYMNGGSYSPAMQNLRGLGTAMNSQARESMGIHRVDNYLEGVMQSAGISPENPTATNQLHVNLNTAVAQDDMQYRDFRQRYFAANHTLQGAPEAWAQYSRDQPLLDPQATPGTIAINPNRISSQQYFGGQGNGAPGASSGAPPAAPSTAAPSAAPQQATPQIAIGRTVTLRDGTRVQWNGSQWAPAAAAPATPRGY